MRRSLALAAVGTLASSAVLTGAPAALAAAPFSAPFSAHLALPAILATSPTPSATPATGDDQAVPAAVRPRLEVQGLRDRITAGAAPTEFTVELTNPSKSDLVFYPALRVNDKAGDFDTTALTVDYRRGQQDWQPSTVPTYLNTLRLLGPLDQNGVPAPGALIFVKAGRSVSIKVRLGLPADNPTGPAFAQFVSYWAPVDAQRQPTQAGEMSASRPSYFCVVSPGTPKPSHSPTGSASPTVEPSSSPTVPATPSASPSSPATPPASPSAPATPSAPPSTSASPSPSGSASPSPSPSQTPAPTPSTGASATPTPSATPSRSATPAPSASATATPAPSTPAPASALPGGPSSSPSSSSSDDTVTPFPVQPPAAAVLPIPATAVQQAQASAAADEKSLAFTGGGGDAVPIAVTGATVFALGVGTLVLLRRRKGGARHA
ncbi:hypothetical protein OG500_18710 [Kitasatospora sp. NBC_01250]|uniref:hypothetical protein n=1 Tax=Kitasatospora sp. NBC_01250 TaxID=2903571 RepID=UPI002E378120|nr:hypothetical protein [Kitasatospora sp. NBC_01250]